MTTRVYTNPRTGEIIDDPNIRPLDEILRELGEGSTMAELSEAMLDLVQRVQDTAKAGHLTLTVAVGFDGQGRLVVKDEVKVKLPEYSRPETRFFIDNSGNASRRDPNQPLLPSLEDHRNRKDQIS